MPTHQFKRQCCSKSSTLMFVAQCRPIHLVCNRLFVTFIDEHLHFCLVYLVQKLKDAAQFADFVAFTKTRTGKRVETLRSDNGGIIQMVCDDEVLQQPQHRAKIYVITQALVQ